MALAVGNSGTSHNGIFRGKSLGTISNLNEYLAFRQAHGIADGTYKDLYLGDYFTIQDGTYNVNWVVAHFNYYFRKTNTTSAGGTAGVVLIPNVSCGTSKMNNSSTTEGGYIASLAHTSTLPTIAAALSTIFGSYLASIKVLVSNAADDNLPSMAGSGKMGAASGWTWTETQCILPSEIQIIGANTLTSSYRDIGEANQKLALFNFINSIQYGRVAFWTRSIAYSKYFALCTEQGYVNDTSASTSEPVRPLIYIN